MANVVNVHLLQVDGHTYRQRTQTIDGKPQRQQQQQQQQHYKDEEEAAAAAWEEQQHKGEAVDAGEDELVDDSLISQDGGNYVTRISVDPQLIPHIIGKERRKQKEIEGATGATLQIQRTGQRSSGSSQQQQQQQQQGGSAPLLGSSKGETITIKAPSKQALSAAHKRVEVVIATMLSGRTLDYTHFLSLPLSNKQTAAKLKEFQQQVLAQPGAQEKGFDPVIVCGSRLAAPHAGFLLALHRIPTQVLAQPGAQEKGFEPSIFVDAASLHLTLLMLKLYSDEARHKAATVLQGLAPQVQALLGGQPLLLQLAGLDRMSDDPSDMHVAYLKVKELGSGNRLSQLCDMLLQAFKQAGLTVPGQLESVKLHATVINTRYRRSTPASSAAAAAAAAAVAVSGQRQGARGGGSDRQQQQQQQQQQRIGVDGRQLLEDWSGFDLGQFEVPAVHLSLRGQYDASGYYACAAALSLKPSGQ
uniref:K Homology domain-containing protein n=1 Tax=Tetradesmus obliquus TaxID=3088 RepID=A0A383VIG8_TETOB